jgi:hypothetical protein
MAMKNVIEFPKDKTSEVPPESVRPGGSSKVFNIADWPRESSIQFAVMAVDAWPFCAA